MGFRIVSQCAEPLADEGWLYQIKHDGHRLVAIDAGERLHNAIAPSDRVRLVNHNP